LFNAVFLDVIDKAAHGLGGLDARFFKGFFVGR